MGKRRVGALEKVEADLASLQYKIRRDPASYQDEFEKQYNQYRSQREIFLQAPSTATDAGIVSLKDLIDLVAHVADCYQELTAAFPGELADLLKTHHVELEPSLREKIVGSLVLLKRKELIDSPFLLSTLFPILVSTPSKSLRSLILQKVLMDIRSSNAKSTDHRLNRTVQRELEELVRADRSSPKALWAVKIVRELWRRQIWTDSRSVEIMKEACLSDNVKVIAGAVHFFLGGDKEREEMEDDSSDEEAVSIGRIKHQLSTNKKTKKKMRTVENAIAQVKKKERKKKQPHPLNFSAFHLLDNPQGFAEDLFSKHLQNTKSRLTLEQKLPVLQLVSRLIGLHELIILGFYSYFIKYLTPRQSSVTSLLASLAQATHKFVPPDALEPLVQKIANEFVSEASAGEVASAGLNAIREICARQPLAINETLLQDLVMYRKSKDKGVMMAARGLLSLYRQVDAQMLRKRDRGKEGAIGLQLGERKRRRFGEQEAEGIEGLELLEKWKEEERLRRADNEQEASESDGVWEVDEDESDDSGGWINVESDEEIILSDSDDEQVKPRPLTAEGMSSAEVENKENFTISAPGENISSIAVSRILTPADHAKLRELRLEASLNKSLPASQRKRLARQAAAQQARHHDDPLTQDDIEAVASLSKKVTKEEKVALAKDGKGERREHKSTKAIRQAKKNADGKSSTNREKARKKNFMMTLGKAKAKGKRSLVDRGKVLKAHVDRGKRGGKRGNRG